jgi:uncharacterized protein (DUF885 family)
MRSFHALLAFAIVLVVVSCTGISDENTRFEALADQYLEQMLQLNPQWATYLGDHRYDHLMNDYSLEGVQKELTFIQDYLDLLKEIDPTLLGLQNRIDYDIWQHSLKSRIFRLDTLRSFEWNPRAYNVGGAIYGLLARDFAPLEERLQSVKERLKAIPNVLEQARINLKNPPEIYTETAIRQNKGTISLIGEGLNEFVEKVPALKDEIVPLQEQAIKALEEYGEWMENDLLPRSDGDFRLGYNKYRAKLRYTLHSELTPEVILKTAETDLAATQEVMYETALPLYREFFPDKPTAVTHEEKLKVIKKVLDRLAEDRPNADNIVDVINASLKECDDFVRASDLVTHPGEPIKVIVMPEFQRGVAIGYCDSPGALEEKGETFYAISPPPDDWDEDRVESYFREYNKYMLHDLTIHEAMPGHYLQIAHANNLEAPTRIRSIFGSGTFVEGWATYAEELMVEKGFGGAEVKMQQLKMRLRMIINSIIDQKIHTAGMTEDEAMAMMLNEGLQEEGEAAGKWRRACLTSTQLSTYYIGNLEINEIRDAYMAKFGEQSDLKEFHDKLLSFGSPPPHYVKELMGL